uniref:Uncharacterized protein n=1 Tax=Pseudomonas phage HRDY3 TaxID=3236930 RepID=A0AB39CEL0_9VIRU
MSLNQTPYVGALTAFNNGRVPMTVHNVIRAGEDGEGEVENVLCVYFTDSNQLQYADGKPENFIGFGESLIFEAGVFTGAFNNAVDDEEEEEEEEELEDEEPANNGSAAQ